MHSPGFLSKPAGVTPSAVTWDPSFKNANLTLSGGNLIATGGALTFQFTSALSTGSITAGKKKYFEVTVTANGSTAGTFGVGVGNASTQLGNNQYLGLDLNSIGAYDNGNVFMNATQIATVAPFATGSVVCTAVDFTAGLIWWRTNNGNWNNSSTANPATGTGGISIGAAGTLSPAIALYYDGVTLDVATGNFSSSTSFTPPAGFSTFP
jgi:SPRY domain